MNKPTQNKPTQNKPTQSTVTGNNLNRRTLLRGSGVAMSLPWLTAMQASAGTATQETPRRFVSVSIGLGLLGDNLFPENPGADYEPSRYLKSLNDIRDQFSVVSGSSHPDVNNGHRAEASILTATPIGNTGSAKNTISVDQLLAKYLGGKTRYPSLVLSTKGSQSPSYTENGSMISAEDSPAELFAKLFVNESKVERQKQAERIRSGRSIMDVVGEDARRLQRELGAGDRDRLDAYFTSVRDLEKRMAANEDWAKLPKPVVDAKLPKTPDQNDLVGRQALMLDLIKLALKTDSSRFISLHIPAGNSKPPIEGVDQGYHTLSHHGRDEDKLSQLALIEEQIVAAWGGFLRDLQSVEETGGTLLDHTSVLMTSNLGNASSHDNRNLPVLFAGGGFEHGKHVAFDRKNNYPLANLFVSVLQQTGLEVDQFSSGKGTMKGLEPTRA
jgi:hypothetical protein